MNIYNIYIQTKDNEEYDILVCANSISQAKELACVSDFEKEVGIEQVTVFRLPNKPALGPIAWTDIHVTEDE